MLICPVRGCGLALVREGRLVRCAAKHSFDVARSGYLNLLQPQERRAKNPGDTAEAAAARRRLHDRGFTAPLLAGIREVLRPDPTDTILDAGCGDGYYLGEIVNGAGCKGCGVDISIPAVNAAARRYPVCEWIVANADRRIPYSGAAFTAVMSITARQNPAEFRRVLREDGRLLVALPSPRDLIELRGKGREDRVDRALREFASFRLVERTRVETRADLEALDVKDLLTAIYRPFTEMGAARPVTLSLDLLLFRP